MFGLSEWRVFVCGTGKRSSRDWFVFRVLDFEWAFVLKVQILKGRCDENVSGVFPLSVLGRNYAPCVAVEDSFGFIYFFHVFLILCWCFDVWSLWMECFRTWIRQKILLWLVWLPCSWFRMGFRCKVQISKALRVKGLLITSWEHLFLKVRSRKGGEMLLWCVMIARWNWAHCVLVTYA